MKQVNKVGIRSFENDRELAFCFLCDYKDICDQCDASDWDDIDCGTCDCRAECNHFGG